jgi:hypothetical protein
VVDRHAVLQVGQVGQVGLPGGGRAHQLQHLLLEGGASATNRPTTVLVVDYLSRRRRGFREFGVMSPRLVSEDGVAHYSPAAPSTRELRIERWWIPTSALQCVDTQ